MKWFRLGHMPGIVSPTHKRAEGRAPVWGSEFTSKTPHNREDPAETAARLNAKLWTSVAGDWWWWWHLTTISPSPPSILFEESTKNLAPQSCGGAMRTTAPSMPSNACPGRAAGDQRYKYVSVVERPQKCSDQQLELVEGISPRGLTCLCTEKARYINSVPLYICRVVYFLLRQRRGAGLVCDSVAALALASCNEHGSTWPKQMFHDRTRPHLACFARCPPKVQSSRGRRKNLTFSFGEHARTPPAFLCSRAKLPHGVSYIFPSPRPLFPACSPPPSCFFSRDCTPADGLVRLSDGYQVLRGVVRRARHWRQRRVLWRQRRTSRHH
jgi:hypothetical protein